MPTNASQKHCIVVLKNSATETQADEFKRQVAEFLSGVVNHDPIPFFKHLSPKHFLLSILPSRVIRDYLEYVEFQEQWNDNKVAKWTYTFEQIYLTSSTQGFVVILAVYEDTAGGHSFKKTIRITDHFVLDNGVWFMTENQNTVIEAIQGDH